MIETFDIAGYARISVDDEQDQKNISIENQKAIIEDYVKTHFPGSTLTFFEDRDRSGYTFEQREGYQEMRRGLMSHKYDILIIHDNAYSDIIFDGAVGNSFFNTPGAMDVGVEFFSLSKSFNVTGARISFLVGRRDVVAAFKKLRGQIDFGMFLPVQKAAIAALTGPLDMVKTQCGLYQQRRDALCGGLRSIGWNVPDSHGSMFVWAPIPAKYAKSMDFCLDLVEKSGVLCTPGSSFGPLGEGYVRFALTLPPERIAEAVKSIKVSGILD